MTQTDKEKFLTWLELWQRNYKENYSLLSWIIITNYFVLVLSALELWFVTWWFLETWEHLVATQGRIKLIQFVDIMLYR